ncbi:MAG TPA: protein kinase [Terriglobales bacterium]|nr:protein kinase [Terriglobales bacterium]
MASPETQPPSSSSAHDLSGTTVGRFRVLRRIGRGGMGEVYAATDTALKRTVALKRVAPHLRDDPQQLQRITKEAERASALNHPSIAAIYDLLQQDGEAFLVMEYVEGVSLRERLRSRLSRDELLDIVIQCAEALEAAHARGILHGDVKPENILIAAGRVKLLDFGVARRIPTEVELTTATNDTWGGTIGYMAPEALMQQESDRRSDLFSLGVILYEGISGQHPFRVSSMVLTLDRTLHLTPPSLSTLAPNTHPALAAIVDRLLAKDPKDRYASAADLAHDLRGLLEGTAVVTTAMPRRPRRVRKPATRWAIAIFLVVTLAAALALLASRWWPSAPPLPAHKVLAVLPFRSEGATSDEQAYADGIGAGVSAHLARVLSPDQAQVALYSDVLRYNVSSAAQARKSLGANLALQGSLRRAGGSLQLQYSLSDTQTGNVFRAGQLSAADSSPSSLEQQAVDTLVAALHLRAVRGPAATPTSPASADYLRGQGYLQRGTPDGIENAIAAFSQALAHDPKLAPALVGLGQADLRKFNNAHDPTLLDAALQACSQAVLLDAADATGPLCLAGIATRRGRYSEAAAQLEKAVALDARNTQALSQLGLTYLRLGRIELAEETAARVIQVRPDFWASHVSLGDFYSLIGRYQQAIEQEREAVRLAPDLSEPYFALGTSLLFAGQYDEAVTALQHCVSLAPDYRVWSNLGTAYLALRKFDDAVNSFEQAYRIAPGQFVAAGNLARAYYWSGRKPQAQAQYRDAIRAAEAAWRVNPKDYGAALMLAAFHAMVGEPSQAMQWLTRAQALNPNDAEWWYWAAILHNQSGDRVRTLSALEKAVALGYSRSDVRSAPELDNLHSDPHFQALVRAQ